MPATLPITFTHHDGESVRRILDAVVLPLYEVTHTELLQDPFYSVERFVTRVRGYTRSPGFEMVVAEAGDQAVAQAFGYALPAGARWWHGLTTPVDAEAIAETGSRTFALCELMVHPDWQRRGVSRSLHDELLHHRLEERATLMVREENLVAQRAYAKWGWRNIGKVQPYADAPHYDALVLPLR